MSDDRLNVGLAVGCALAGGTTGGGTVVAILNHGFSVAALILCLIAVALTVAAFVVGSDAVGGSS